MNASRVYLDYAAATPLDPSVNRAMDEAEAQFANPASLHAEGRAAREALDGARADIARVLAARPDEIIFTSSTTEANNLALFGALAAVGHERVTVLTVATEHAAVRQPMRVLREQGVVVREVSLREDGRVELEALKDALTDDVVLVSVAMVTSEVGTLQPMGEIAQLVKSTRADRQARDVKTPLLFHSDAAAAAGLLSLHVSRLGIDLMTFGASKLYGPVGIAALYVRTGTPLAPMLLGGGQERGRRAGTEPVALCVGFATALTQSEGARKTELARLQDLRAQLQRELGEIPGARFNHSPKHSLANTLNLSLDGRDGEDLALALDARGFAVATGAACAESQREPSHVLRALGRSESEAQGSLRITLGRQTTSEEVMAFAKALREVVSA